MGLQCDKQPASLGRNGSSGVDWCPIERHSPLNRLIGFLSLDVHDKIQSR
jgi:hypothetical protein